MYTGVILAAIKGVEACLNEQTWFLVAILQIVSSLLFYGHNAANLAYTSELSLDGVEQAVYNSSFLSFLYASMILFMVTVLLVSLLLGLGDIGTARVSQTLTASVCLPLFYLTWTRLIRNRPALTTVEATDNVISFGFRRLWSTAQVIFHNHGPLRWLLVAVALSESAMAALTTISTTYMTQILAMNANEIAVVFLFVLVACVPGSKLGARLAQTFRSPITSTKMANVFLAVTTFSACFFLDGPEDKRFAKLFGMFWGLGIGWLSPMDTSSFITLKPPGNETEWMANYLMATMILFWLPPIVFTTLNEHGFPMVIGMASLGVYFVLALLSLSLVFEPESHSMAEIVSPEDDEELDEIVPVDR